jgi:hypothetical protein
MTGVPWQMLDPMQEKAQANDRPAYNWAEVWLAAVSRPRLETYHELLRDRNATPLRSWAWLAIAMAVSGGSSLVQILYTPELSGAILPPGTADTGSVMVLALLCGVPFGLALSLGMFAALLAMIHYASTRLYRAAGEFNDLLIVAAAIAAPMTLLAAVASFVPLLGAILGLALQIGQFVLIGIASRVVYGHSAENAAVAVGLPVLVWIGLQFVLLGAVL